MQDLRFSQQWPWRIPSSCPHILCLFSSIFTLFQSQSHSLSVDCLFFHCLPDGHLMVLSHHISNFSHILIGSWSYEGPGASSCISLFFLSWSDWVNTRPVFCLHCSNVCVFVDWQSWRSWHSSCSHQWVVMYHCLQWFRSYSWTQLTREGSLVTLESSWWVSWSKISQSLTLLETCCSSICKLYIAYQSKIPGVYDINAVC